MQILPFRTRIVKSHHAVQFYALSEELFHNSIQRRFTGDIFLGHLHLVLLTRNEIQTSCFLFAQNFMLYHRCTGCGAKGGAAPPPPQRQKKLGKLRYFGQLEKLGKVYVLYSRRGMFYFNLKSAW